MLLQSVLPTGLIVCLITTSQTAAEVPQIPSEAVAKPLIGKENVQRLALPNALILNGAVVPAKMIGTHGVVRIARTGS